MMLFPPREATTTAEPPEPLTFQHSEIFIFKQILQRIVGPAARHSVYSVCSVDSNMLIFRAFRAFRGSISIILAAAWPLHVICGPFDKDI